MKYVLSIGLITSFSLSVLAQQNLADKLILPNNTCEIPQNSIVLKANAENSAMILKPFVDIDPKMNICQPLPPTTTLLEPTPKFDGTIPKTVSSKKKKNKGNNILGSPIV